jgi:hypothetical protein
MFLVESEPKPSVRQVYALAAALCERLGEEFPSSRAAASETIERLRLENGHPAPRLDDASRRPRGRRRSGRGGERSVETAAAEPVRGPR